jgi:hypothetical protein
MESSLAAVIASLASVLPAKLHQHKMELVVGLEPYRVPHCAVDYHDILYIFSDFTMDSELL